MGWMVALMVVTGLRSLTGTSSSIICEEQDTIANTRAANI